MAEINEPDLISRGALQAPSKLAKEFDQVIEKLRTLKNEAKATEGRIMATKSISKLAKETDGLRKSQRALSQEQERAAKIAKVLWLSENEVAESMKRAAKETQHTGDVLSDLDKAQAAAANSAAALAKQQQQAAGQNAAIQKAYKAQTGTLQELVQKRIQLQNANKNQLKNQQEDADLLKKGVLTRQEYNQRMVESEAIITRNKAAIQGLNAQIKTHITQTGTVGNEYKKLTLQLDQARAKYKDMAAAGTASSKVLKDQQKVVADLDAKVRAIDQAAGQFQRNVGNYPKTFQAATSSLMSFLSAFGLVTGMALFAKIFKDIINLGVEFEHQNSILRGVLGATAQETQQLKDQQLSLAESTIYTAKQYAELQIELAKLGFSIPQIKAMTESTAEAALAMGSDLGPQAELTGSIIRQFSLKAADAGVVNDELAKSTAATALGFDSLSTAMPYVGAAASKLGFSLSDTLALMGELSNNGLEASTIGTSLRSVLLSLADSNSKLSKTVKEPVRDLKGFINLLKTLNAEGTDLGEALDLTDKRTVTAFASLLKGEQSLQTLSSTIKNATGFTKELADTVKDDLWGDLTLLESAVSSVGISIQQAFDAKLRKLVQTITGWVMWLKMLPKFLKDNRGLIVALGLAILALNVNTIKATISTLAYELAMKKMIIQERLALISTKSLYAAMAANPIGAVLLALSALTAAITIYDRNSTRAMEVEKQRLQINKDLAYTQKILTDAQKQLNITVDDWLKMTEDQQRSHAEQIQAMVNLARARRLDIEAQKLQLEQTSKQLTLWQQLKVGLASRLFPNQMGVQVWEYQMENAAEATEGLDQAIANLKQEEEGLTHLLDENVEAQKRATEAKKDAEKVAAAEDLRARQRARKAQLDLDRFRLEQQIKTLEEIMENDKNSQDVRLKAELELEQKRRALANNERQKSLIEEVEGRGDKAALVSKSNAELILIEEQFQAKLNEISKKGQKDRDKINDFSTDKAIKDSQYRAKKILSNIEKEYNDRIAAETQAIQKQVLAGQITREKGDMLIAEAQRKHTKDLLEFSIQQYKDMLRAERTEYFDARLKMIEESNMTVAEKEAAVVALKRESADEQMQIEQEISELETELAELNYQAQVDKYEKMGMLVEKYGQKVQNVLGAVSALFGAISAKRLSDIDSEEKRANDYFDKQKELSEGNEAAQKRIDKEKERRQREFDRRRITEQRRMAKLEKAQAIVSATIAGALTVLNALSTVKPYPAAVVAAVSAGVLAGVQIAAIAAAPLPQYAEGVKMGVHPGGPALVGEEGMERMRTPGGRISFTPDRPTIMDVPRGTEITPHDQTMRDMALAGLMRGVRHDVTPDHAGSALLSEVRGMRKEIKNLNGDRVDLVHQTGIILEAHNHRDQHINMVRSRAMGKWRKK